MRLHTLPRDTEMYVDSEIRLVGYCLPHRQRGCAARRDCGNVPPASVITGRRCQISYCMYAKEVKSQDQRLKEKTQERSEKKRIRLGAVPCGGSYATI